MAPEMNGDAIAAPSNRTYKTSQIVATALSPWLDFSGRCQRDPLPVLIGRMVGLRWTVCHHALGLGGGDLAHICRTIFFEAAANQ